MTETGNLLRTLNRQFISLDEQNGSEAVAVDVANALKVTLNTYEGDTSPQGLVQAMGALYEIFLECKPRIANTALDLQHALASATKGETTSVDDLIAFLDARLEHRREKIDQIESVIESFFQEPKTVLLHSQSKLLVTTFLDVAKHHPEMRVIVAGQEEQKTNQIIKALAAYGVRFEVVSEYSIVHVEEELDLALFGSSVLKEDGTLVMGPGSRMLVSQLYAGSVPLFVLSPTNKCHLWKDDSEPTYQETRQKVLGDIVYKKQVFSHDLVDVKQFTGVITERGVLSPSEALALFEELQSEFRGREEVISKG